MRWKEFASHIRYLSTADLGRVERAFALGERAHQGQKRRSGEPYWSHPVAVAQMLAGMDADADALIAALLHDAVEDTPLSLEDIKREFDGAIPTLIDGVTKLTAAEFADKPTLNEQIETLRKMFTLMQRDIRIMVIKLSDRLHNIQTAEYLEPEKQMALAQETMDIYAKIADRLGMQDLRSELEGLSLAILEPGLWHTLTELHKRNERTALTVLGQMQKSLAASHPALIRETEVLYEPLRWEKLRRFNETGGTAATGIASFAAVFVCREREECYRILGALHEAWQREVMSFQDYVNAPMINGYRGLHTTIILPDGTRVRCKIRTKEMQEYAHRGIATVCFGTETKKMLDWLPWLGRITPLSEDTTQRSDEFWESLKSDILGESIVIHGPGDQAVLVPKGSTALDGVFYLFGKEALRQKTILVNGREVPSQTPLKHADSVEITLDRTTTVERSWLDWVQTGIAAAKIRAALAKSMTPEEKIALGKHMLQNVLQEHRKGFIEEFDQDSFLPRFQALGYNTLDDTYVALADGHAKPREIFDALMSSTKVVAGSAVKRLPCAVRIMVRQDDVETLHRLLNVYKKYQAHQRKLRLWPIPGTGYVRITSSVFLSEQELECLKIDVRSAGVQDCEVIVRSKGEWALLATVIFTWALNPVLAQWLMRHGMPPTHLLTIRFLTFSVFTIVFFLVWRHWHRTRLSSLPPLLNLAIIPTIANAVNALATYLTLTVLPPSVHLTILRFNTLLPLSPDTHHKRSWTRLSLELFLLLLLTIMGLYLMILGKTILVGLVFSALTLFTYTFYSLTTENTLKTHRIDMRYPYLLLSMGMLLGGTGLLLLIGQGLAPLHHPLLWKSVGYVFLCVCVPHTCYTALLKTTAFKNITDLFLLEVPLAIFLEFFLLGTALSFTVYVVTALTVLGILLVHNKAFNMFNLLNITGRFAPKDGDDRH